MRLETVIDVGDALDRVIKGVATYSDVRRIGYVYRPLARGRSHVTNADDAEDIVMDSLLVALNKRDKALVESERGTLARWFGRIVGFVACNRGRASKRARERNVSLDDLPPGGELENNLVVKPDQPIGLLVRFCAHLEKTDPDKARQFVDIFLYRFDLRCSWAEVAEVVGVSEVAVRRRWSRLVKEMRIWCHEHS